MPVLVREADDLRFDGGTVARPDAGDRPAVERAAIQILADDPVRLLVRPGQITDRAVFRRRPGGEGEGDHGFVPRLELHPGEIHAPGVDAGRGPGLEAAQGQAERAQTVGESLSGVHAVRPGALHLFAGDHRAVQIGPGCDHNGLHAVDRSKPRRHGADRPVPRLHGDHHRLLEIQILLQFQDVLHILLVFPPVCLSAQGVDRRAFSAVEHPVLDAAGVCGPAHLPAEGIQLADQMPLSGPADGGVAGHIAHGVQIDRKDDGFQSEPGGRKRGLDARVSRADDGDVVVARMIGHKLLLSSGPAGCDFLYYSGSGDAWQ